ncbi:MAG: urea ABC transporter ATP-binding subunit UrtE [Dehalococcoidia bacterium]|nr:urea ABC transporter ATP-binding subunit UrtE [Dehalococcoidia bacterium]
MLVVQDLSASYGESQILFDISLRVPEGQVVSLMGRNGVGKTTLLKSIMGLMRPKSGQVHLKGVNVTARPAYERARAGIGYVPQGRGIFPYLTVEENLLLGLEALPTNKRGLESIEEICDQFPSLRTYKRKVAGTLSGGQQQQLAFARALVRKPTLLLLDEPTEGIQPSIVDEIEQLILGLREQRSMSILLVEQFLDFAMSVSDYCYVMEKGNIVAEGAAGELQQDAIREYLAV